VGRDGSGVLVCPDHTQALLAAAESNHLSMFGDLSAGTSPVYVTRAAVSLKRHSFTEVGADFDPDIDATGRRLVFASTRHSVQPDLYIKSVDGVAVTQLTADPAPDIQPAFSPDGTRIAFASRRGGNWDIWIIGVEGGPPVQVTSGAADDVHPSWSPDGSRLVFCSLSVAGGQWELWIAPAAAGASRQFIGYGLFPEWSPVEDVIVYQRARERGSRWFSIWTLRLADGEPQYPTEVACSVTEAMILPSWSPDGRRIAYASTSTVVPLLDGTLQSNTGEVFDIWVVSEDGRGKTRLTDGHTFNYAPAFSPDGRVFFASNRSGHENTWSLIPAVYPPGSRDDILTGVEVKTEGPVRRASHNDDL